ncbi:MAG: hypothetical protein REI78_02610 [Pedobacter sp.]|nr:hypothetical protein [Pedobacter sp.]MDQ8051884.1 hypothetical protein [Pedobacter sp.]
MEFITEKDERYVLISNQENIDEIVDQISQGIRFAHLFKFSERKLFISLLELLGIQQEDFEVKYFHYSSSRKLHISESHIGYVWISTHGLVARKKPTTNRAVNACFVQYTVITILLKRAIEVIEDENVYNIDSYRFGQLSDLSPGIFHNLTFYVEVFCKAYLSLVKIQAPKSHSLKVIYQKTVDAMINNKHDNSLFQILVLDPLYTLVDHVGKIPGEFKEHFIKYDDNPLDDTVILFDLPGLQEMTMLLELSNDFMSDFYYMGADTYYLESKVYERMMERAETEEKKKRIQALYPHLAKKG